MTDDTKLTRIVRIGRVKFAAPDANARIFEGTASTSRIDRVGDVLEPLGAEWELPVPLLLDHDSTQQVGKVKLLRAGQRGIRFTAEVSRIDADGRAKELTDFAWQLVRSGLRGAVSVGFRGLDSEPLRNGGRRFTKWELLELSLVSIPAQPDAKIDGVSQAKSSPIVVPEAIRPRARKVKLDDKDHAAARKASPSVFRRSELKKIERRLREIEKAKVHILKMDALAGPDPVRINANTATLKALEREREALVSRQIGIRAGIIDPAVEAAPDAPQTTAAPARKPAAWDVKNLPAPSVPDSISGMSQDARMAELVARCEHHADRLSKLLSDSGVGPDDTVRFADVAIMVGNALGAADWAFLRCAELERRMAAVEATGIRYLGVYQRATEYRKGDVVTFAGSAWVAIKAVTEGTVPGGDTAAWQLAVRAGKDGKDAR